MRILVDVTHPAHVHFFKHAIWDWERRGHEVAITARDKGVAIELLDQYGFSYTDLGVAKQGLFGVGRELFARESQIYRIVRGTGPDVLTAISGAYIVHVGKLLNVPTVVFADTEHARISHLVSFPFATAIYTPACFQRDLGGKQRRYEGYHELAYLHPDRFSPDRSVLARLGLNTDEPFFVVRFVSWGAHHDVGQRGFSDVDKRRLIGLLKRYGRVVLTSEVQGASELLDHGVKIPAGQLHHVLGYAAMYVGEGGTMATEAALLGIPSVFVSTLSGGNWCELEHKYHLMYALRDGGAAIEQVRDLLGMDNLRDAWQARRERMLADKIDVTQVILDAVEQVVAERGKGRGI
jgi:predicted glycosyltransferase